MTEAEHNAYQCGQEDAFRAVIKLMEEVAAGQGPVWLEPVPMFLGGARSPNDGEVFERLPDAVRKLWLAEVSGR
jgi:hypothetical protein